MYKAPELFKEALKIFIQKLKTIKTALDNRLRGKEDDSELLKGGPVMRKPKSDAEGDVAEGTESGDDEEGDDQDLDDDVVDQAIDGDE
jgi:hypothetical protein